MNGIYVPVLHTKLWDIHSLPYSHFVEIRLQYFLSTVYKNFSTQKLFPSSNITNILFMIVDCGKI